MARALIFKIEKLVGKEIEKIDVCLCYSPSFSLCLGEQKKNKKRDVSVLKEGVQMKLIGCGVPILFPRRLEGSSIEQRNAVNVLFSKSFGCICMESECRKKREERKQLFFYR